MSSFHSNINSSLGLLKSLFDFFINNNNGSMDYNMLIAAINNGNYKRLKQLIIDNKVNVQENFNEAICLSVCLRNVKIFKLLYRYGANLYTRNHLPLQLSIIFGDRQIVKFILKEYDILNVNVNDILTIAINNVAYNNLRQILILDYIFSKYKIRENGTVEIGTMKDTEKAKKCVCNKYKDIVKINFMCKHTRRKIIIHKNISWMMKRLIYC